MDPSDCANYSVLRLLSVAYEVLYDVLGERLTSTGNALNEFISGDLKVVGPPLKLFRICQILEKAH